VMKNVYHGKSGYIDFSLHEFDQGDSNKGSSVDLFRAFQNAVQQRILVAAEQTLTLVYSTVYDKILLRCASSDATDGPLEHTAVFSRRAPFLLWNRCFRASPQTII
jgi:hypothetical protein